MSDPVKRSDDLTVRENAVGGPDALIEALRSSLRKQGLIIKWVIVCMVLGISLTVALGIVIRQVSHNTSVTNLNANIVYETCVSANKDREATRNLWYRVLNTPSTQKLTFAETVARTKQINSFRDYVTTKFADASCVDRG